MMRLTMFALAIAALTVAGSSAVLRLRSDSTAAMPSLQDLQRTASLGKLPIQHIEDRSLVFDSDAKQYVAP